MRGISFVVALTFTGGLSGRAVAQEGAEYLSGPFEGQPAPGGGFYNSFEEVRIGGDRRLAYHGTVSDSADPAAFTRIWSGEIGVERQLVRAGMAAPGGSGTYASFSDLAVNPAGRVAFVARPRGSRQNRLFAETPDGIVLGIQNSQIGGVDEGISDVGVPGFNQNLDLAVKVELVNAEGEGFNSALLVGRPGNVAAVMKQGDPAPGIDNFRIGSLYGSGFDFTGPGENVVINGNGELAFVAQLEAVVDGGSEESGPDSFGPNPNAIYFGKPSNLQILALVGNPIPGEVDSSYAIFFSDVALSSDGLLAFVAIGENEFSSMDSVGYVLMLGRPGAVAPVVRQGDAVPGGGDGVVFGSFRAPAVNARGDVVFGAEINYPNGTSRSSLWLKRVGEAPVLVAAEGNVFQTPNGPAEVTGVQFDGHGAFNDVNQATFVLQLFNGEGVYVADTRSGYPVVSITTPATRNEQVVARASRFIGGTAIDESGVDRVEVVVTSRGVTRKKRDGKMRRRARRVVERTLEVANDGSWGFKAPLLLGRNRISVRAVDAVGNASPSTDFTVIRWKGPRNSSKGQYRKLKRQVRTPN
ncbi:MAG: choice-of-anchor tandem repeat NxxGxxAF-containing protein [Chthoniobacterales bacterium]